jgi:predicted nucleotidyltransferase
LAARVSSQITPDKVQEAVRRIVHAGRPRKVILFGSYVSGKTKPDSDLDILVIGDDTIPDTRTESVRIRRFLRGLMMPMDILVVRESQYNALKDRPGLIYREIEKTGKVVYESR